MPKSTRLLSLLGAGLLCSSLPSMAYQSSEIASLDLSNKSLRLNYKAMQPRDNRMFDVGILHHTDNGQLANVGLHALNQLSLGQLAIGARLYGWHADLNSGSEYGGALALGANWDVTLAHWGNPIGFGFSGYVAPEVTTFNKAKGLVDLDAQIYYQLMPNARAHIGYRMTNLDLKNNDHTLDQGMHVGMALNF